MEPEVSMKGISKSGEDNYKVKFEVEVDDFDKAVKIAKEILNKLQKELVGQTELGEHK